MIIEDRQCISFVREIFEAMHQTTFLDKFNNVNCSLSVVDITSRNFSFLGATRHQIVAEGATIESQNNLDFSWFVDASYSFLYNKIKQINQKLDLLLHSPIKKTWNLSEVTMLYIFQHKDDPSAIYIVSTDESDSKTNLKASPSEIEITRCAIPMEDSSTVKVDFKHLVTQELLYHFRHADKSHLLTQIYENPKFIDYIDLRKLSEQCLNEATVVDFQILSSFISQAPKETIEVRAPYSPKILDINLDISTTNLMNSSYLFHYSDKVERVYIHEILKSEPFIAKQIDIHIENYIPTEPSLRKVFMDALNQYFSTGKVNVRFVAI